MVVILQWVLGLVIMGSTFFSAIYSYKARKQTDGRIRGLYTSRMNMSMGIMLIAIALIQMFMFSGSTIRVIVGAIFILLGLFNLFAGIRNHSHFKRLS